MSVEWRGEREERRWVKREERVERGKDRGERGKDRGEMGNERGEREGEKGGKRREERGEGCRPVNPQDFLNKFLKGLPEAGLALEEGTRGYWDVGRVGSRSHRTGGGIRWWD